MGGCISLNVVSCWPFSCHVSAGNKPGRRVWVSTLGERAGEGNQKVASTEQMEEDKTEMSWECGSVVEHLPCYKAHKVQSPALKNKITTKKPQSRNEREEQDRGSHPLTCPLLGARQVCGTSHLCGTWQRHLKTGQVCAECVLTDPCCFNALSPCPILPQWHPSGFQRKGWQQHWRPEYQYPHEGSQPRERRKVWSGLQLVKEVSLPMLIRNFFLEQLSKWSLFLETFSLQSYPKFLC